MACVTNRAAVTRAIGDFAGARDLARQAAEGFEKMLGADHPYTLAARMNQAIFAAEWGAVPEAYDMLEPLAARTERVLGPEHPDTARCAANLVLMRRDLYGSTPLEEQESVRRLTAALGATHPAVEAMRERRYLHRTLDPHPF
jgi:hypothetical protein